jgi:glycosyltransferase involved in cell wall biosynthesis
MRILQCISSIDVGGAENFVIELCNELASNKSNSVHLVAFFKPSNERIKKISKNVIFHCLEKKKGVDLKLFIKFFKLLRKLKPDIVHTHLRVIYYILSISILYRTPLFFHTIHYNPNRESEIFIIRGFKQFCFKKNYIKPVFLTQELLEIGSKIYGAKGVVLNNGVKKMNEIIHDSKVVDFIKGLKGEGFDKIFTHIGRICEIKNQELLIDVFNKLDEMKSKACLIFIGYAADSDRELEKRLHFKANKRNIKFVKESRRVKEYLRYSLGFCLTSVNEGQPITIIEALSEGCIPICTAVGGIPSMYNEQEGFTSDVDFESYLEVMTKVIRLTPREQQQISNSSVQAFNEKYSIQTSAKKHMSLYSTLNE